jgi:hypothetical protein
MSSHHIRGQNRSFPDHHAGKSKPAGRFTPTKLVYPPNLTLSLGPPSLQHPPYISTSTSNAYLHIKSPLQHQKRSRRLHKSPISQPLSTGSQKIHSPTMKASTISGCDRSRGMMKATSPMRWRICGGSAGILSSLFRPLVTLSSTCISIT